MEPLPSAALDQLFLEARTVNHFHDTPVPLALLQQAGAIDSPYQFHWRRFLLDHFPKGTGFPALQAPQIADALPVAAVQAFSIDDSQTTEIDDALSVQGLGTGTVVLGIHIAAPGLAIAAEGQGDWIIDTRLRYEFVDQDGFADEARALTLRARLGYETPAWEGFKALVEVEGVAALSDDYNSTTNGNVGYPTVLDPEAAELNRAQISWTGERTSLVVGRQRVILGNARFVGNVGFRQNEQTFDAARVAFKVTPATTVTWIYIDRVQRILGDDSPQGEWDSDSHLVQLETKTPLGQLTAYGYLLDFETAPLQSSATWGARLTGARPLTSGPSITWEVEYARQSDYGSNPVDFDLDYLALSAGLKKDARYVSVGLERLDGNGARGFGTPLATLHAFNGWADVFLATRPGG